MAAKYRKVSVQMWNDKKFRELSDDGKLVFIFVLTHPHMSAIGGMRGTAEGLAAELKWSPKRLSEAFREATERDMVRYDEEACLMILPNFIKHNRPESPNVVVSWQKAFEEMPESYLKFELFQCIERQSAAFPDAFAKAFGSLREAFAKIMPNQEQEQEQEQEKEIVGAAAPVRSRSRTKEDDAEAEEKFAEFWEAYPRKENRKKALAAWKKGQCWNGKFQEIMAALTEQKKNPRWLEDVKYIPHPTTWLNGERWADEISIGCTPSCAHTCSSCQHSENPMCQRRTDEERKSCTGWRAR